jgi:hypothetical protein
MPQRDESSRPTTRRPSTKDRHHGGLEPPDDQQDRPEQNAGYDAAVRGETDATPNAPVDDMIVDDLTGDGQRGVDRIQPDEDDS